MSNLDNLSFFTSWIATLHKVRMMWTKELWMIIDGLIREVPMTLDRLCTTPLDRAVKMAKMLSLSPMALHWPWRRVTLCPSMTFSKSIKSISVEIILNPRLDLRQLKVQIQQPVHNLQPAHRPENAVKRKITYIKWKWRRCILVV